ncbi:MAG: class I SAM-dependent methyltransferase [Clostridiales bacterium]|nr:class I SAM-dependent methyltransferase [Clostridiales bacterium]MDY3746880.1 class I SAM-dependent methyltransferase [Lachnospiraceae bacterium]
MIRLSDRLLALAEFVTPGHRLADIGTDHGYVPIYLTKSNTIPLAIAMDINEGPLKKAEEHIISHQLESRIKTRLSDGLEKLLPGEADTVLIAGMGGALMSRIIENGREVLKTVPELILQPQSEIARFRHFLHDNHYKIVRERMLIDDGKYYVMMKAVHGDEHYDREVFYIYSKLLLTAKDETLHRLIKKELSTNEEIYTRLSSVDTPNAKEKRKLLEEKINYGKEALKYYELQTADSPS